MSMVSSANFLSRSRCSMLASYDDAGPPEPVLAPGLCYLSTILFAHKGVNVFVCGVSRII